MTDNEVRLEESHVEIDGLSIHVARQVCVDKSPVVLLLFNGIGANLELFYPLINSLKGISCITFDAPGAGDSSTPSVPKRFPGLAQLSAKILDHFGYQSVDVLGVSWGGALAQEFARQYPDRCRRLILAATSAGAVMVPGNPSVFLKLASPKRYFNNDYMREVAAHIYGGVLRQHPELINEFIGQLRPPKSTLGYAWQLAAAAGWTSIHWLHKITQPTLVLAGTDDPLVPLVNAKVLALQIPNSRLQEIACGHLFLMTQLKLVGPLISDFLMAEPEKI